MLNSVVGAAGGGARPPQFNRGPSKTRPQSPIGPSPQSMGAMMGQGQPMQMMGQPQGGFTSPGMPQRPPLPTPPAPVEAPEAVPGMDEQRNKQQMPPPAQGSPIGPANPQLMDMLRQKMQQSGNTGITGNISQWGRPGYGGGSGETPWGGMMSAGNAVANYMRPR